MPILVGLTNRQSTEWTDPAVGGLIGLGAVVLALFLVAGARTAEPIVRLGSFRNRAFTISVSAAFLAASGFLTAAVFLRWFEVVGGTSATISGYQMLPLLAGIIIGATAIGGSVVELDGERVYVDGIALDEPYVFGSEPTEQTTGMAQVLPVRRRGHVDARRRGQVEGSGRGVARTLTVWLGAVHSSLLVLG